MAKNVRAHVIVTGRVQGVWFRVETQKAAVQHGVKGWVRNKADGSVEAVFEGGQIEVEKMLNWCEKGAPLSHVAHVETVWEEFSGTFDRFEITH